MCESVSKAFGTREEVVISAVLLDHIRMQQERQFLTNLLGPDSDGSVLLDLLHLESATTGDSLPSGRGMVDFAPSDAISDDPDSVSEALRSSNPATRRVAAVKARQLCARQLLGVLLAVLKTERCPEVRAECVRALGEIGGDEALRACRASLQDVDESVRAAAAVALGLQGALTTEELKELLRRDPSPVVRKASIEVLIQINPIEAAFVSRELVADEQDSRVLLALIEALDGISAAEELERLVVYHRNAHIRAAALWGLRKTDNVGKIALRCLRHDASALVRLVAAMVLSRCGADVEAECVQELMYNEQNPLVRKVLLRLLYRMAPDGRPLVARYKDEPAEEVRREIIRLLGSGAFSECLAELFTTTRRGEERVLILEQLLSIGDERAIRFIRRILRGIDSYDTIVAALELLQKHRVVTQFAAEIVGLLSGHPSPRVRQVAAQLLGEIEGARNVEWKLALERAVVDDPDVDVNIAAMRSLAKQAWPTHAAVILRRLRAERHFQYRAEMIDALAGSIPERYASDFVRALCKMIEEEAEPTVIGAIIKAFVRLVNEETLGDVLYRLRVSQSEPRKVREQKAWALGALAVRFRREEVFDAALDIDVRGAIQGVRSEKERFPASLRSDVETLVDACKVNQPYLRSFVAKEIRQALKLCAEGY